MGDANEQFESFFSKAMGQARKPFPFQRTFALAPDIPAFVAIPTGLGKTAMAVIGWLWRRRLADESVRRITPRRLVYCLPMRVLVEQTRNNAVSWLHGLGVLAGNAKFNDHDGTRTLISYAPGYDDPATVAVHVLMGGEETDDWDIHPERDAIIIGTQDMLLSRALNRGYAATRARWPMHFGLLNTDCLWVYDEIQLMGSGLATTAQLEAFRRSLGGKNGNGCASVWMSATMRPEWLSSVDFKTQIDALPRLALDGHDHRNSGVGTLWQAHKPLSRASAAMDDPAALAEEICETHKSGTRTIVVVNTVKRACELYERIAARFSGGTRHRARKSKADTTGAVAPHLAPTPVPASPRLVLLHSRFRPGDRKLAVDAALAPPTAEGTIIVSTQVIEAGVDVSSTTLFTELAPWPSLVQRFGRCNRKGEENANSQVRWIDLPGDENSAEKAAPPYELRALRDAARELSALEDVGLGSLDALRIELPFTHTHVIRRKDVIDLFDTTPDLAGNDIDIDRYVREIHETDVRVFWRTWEGSTPPDGEPLPRGEELCPAPAWGEWGFKEFAAKGRGRGRVFRRDFLEGAWIAAGSERTPITPGQVYLVHADAGAYAPLRGWDPKQDTPVDPLPSNTKQPDPDDYDDDGLSRTSRWQTIAEHTDDVCNEMERIVCGGGLTGSEATSLRIAARWHDWGKAHAVFQDAVRPDDRPAGAAGSRSVAKAPGARKNDKGVVAEAGVWTKYARKHFRHELASALAVLQTTVPLADVDRDLVAYLIAAHHGKVRLSIRSFPNETWPPATAERFQPRRRFARGVWDGDELPATELGGDISTSNVTLSLEPMELGQCALPPFVGQPSWIERVLRLRDELGPFRLAYLEAALRAADERASKAATQVKRDDHA